MKEVVCDLCNSTSYRIRHVIDVSEKNLRYYRYSMNIAEKENMTGNFNIVECQNCNLIYVNPRIEEHKLNLVYASDKILGGNWKNFWQFFNMKIEDTFTVNKKTKAYDVGLYDWKFDIIEKYFKSTEKIKLLDIGCGDGKFVHDAKTKGYDALGIDLSPERIKNGKELYNLSNKELRCMNIDQFNSDEKFDVIVAWDVIEHLVSPNLFLEQIKRISHKETIILILTMSVDSITYKLFQKNWNYINPPQHLYYFSHLTMKRLYKKCGFDLIGVEMDETRKKNLIHLIFRICIGLINRFILYIYVNESFLRNIFKIFHKGKSYEDMKIRAQDLYPGIYVGRYHDNFVFIGKLNSNNSRDE